jgi:ATP-dependent RNA helicase DDX24/MAK5
MDASIKGKEVEAESRSSKDKIKQAKTPPSPKAPPRVSVAAIVGGMSAHKQRRILGRGVDVLVATPGRLWDIMEQVRKHSLLSMSIRTE